VSSQGCRFRCAFCADPAVYRRAWFGLEPERVGTELAALARRYAPDEVAFQDETFFTSAARVGALCEELGRRALRFTWTATLRADQGARLDAAVLGACVRTGLRRVMVGVESGSAETLAWMQKDATVDQVLVTAERCRAAGIGAVFNLIVGFPGEPQDSVMATLGIARRLRAMSPRFEVAIFYFKPYPGNAIADTLLRQGYRFPSGLEGWADFDYVTAPTAWLDASLRARVEGFRFYQRLAWGDRPLLFRPLQQVARWRCATSRYRFPIERRVIEWWRPPKALA
jgi:radical SAM superfamily enzyme YgiQ (UPF0313 family)